MTAPDTHTRDHKATPPELTRDQVREAFAESGLDRREISRSSLSMLRRRINERMKVSGLIRSSFRCRQRGKIQNTPHGPYLAIRCRAYYFDDREAVSFNTDDFVGFAGWADRNNVQPILLGFMDWLSDMSDRTSGDRAEAVRRPGALQ